MNTSGRVPGLKLAFGAFVLTVLLGIGAGSASGLWQQSATATMTVTADGTWPGLPITVACGSKDKKCPAMYVEVSNRPAQLTFFAVPASGLPSVTYNGPPSRSSVGFDRPDIHD